MVEKRNPTDRAVGADDQRRDRIGPATHLYCDDARNIASRLPRLQVQTVVTSPPYFGQRDYKLGLKELGTEAASEDYVAELTSIIEDIFASVIQTGGSVWLNLGDTIQQGSWLSIPARVAALLRGHGFKIRGEVIWHKPNPMPRQCNYPMPAHEYLFLITRDEPYFYDPLGYREAVLTEGEGDFKQVRSVWTIPVARVREAHFAAMPEELVERCLRLTTSGLGACPTCGAPYYQRAIRERVPTRPGKVTKVDSVCNPTDKVVGNRDRRRHITKVTLDGYEAWCGCNDTRSPTRSVVLDPFMGSGTTGVVAKRLGLDFVGIDLNPEYVALAQRRIANADA